jgi:type VI secretion system protein ImpA
MLKVEDLIAPLSPENPCGEDLSYDHALQELETMIQGKLETQYSEAEEPNWREIRERCLELFGRTKDLHVAIDLTLAWVHEQGFSGLASGLRLVRALLEQYWEPLYPRLDSETGNDPLERMNLLSAFVAPEGTFGDPMQFLRRVRRAPLCHSQRLGTFSLYQAQVSTGKAEAPADGNVPDSGTIDAAFRDSDPGYLAQVSDAINVSIEELNGIADFLDRTVGVTKTFSFDPLKAVLLEARKHLRQYISTAGPEDAMEQQQANAATSTAAAPGTIQSRSDVVRSLEAICTYYERSEPSSPVLPLLRRTQQLVGKNFNEILQELAPETVAHVKLT